jgi:hypothetical protein
VLSSLLLGGVALLLALGHRCGRPGDFTTPTGRWLPVTAGEIELK